MIEYMCTGDSCLTGLDVKVILSGDGKVVSSFALYTRVYLMAKNYGVSSLENLVMERYETETDGLKDSDASDFIKSIQSLYENSSGSECALRDLAVQIAVSHADQILPSETFTLLERQNETAADDIKKEMGRLFSKLQNEIKERDNALKRLNKEERVETSQKQD
jgi:hypothetical protein